MLKGGQKMWVGIIIALIGALILGGGIAYAITAQQGKIQLTTHQVKIVEPEHLTVTDYKLMYADNLEEVTKVRIKVNNSDTVAHIADINVYIKGSVEGTGSLNDANCTPGTSVHFIDISPDVPLNGIETVNIVLQELS